MLCKYAVKHIIIIFKQISLEKSSQKYLEVTKISHNFALAFENETNSKAKPKNIDMIK